MSSRLEIACEKSGGGGGDCLARQFNARPGIELGWFA